MNQLKYPICVVANDAGAANIILGILRDLPISEISLSVEGPAAVLFKKEYPQLVNKNLASAMLDAQTLLSGTSGLSEHEHQARILAKKMGISSIGVIDHWVNYKARFIRNGNEILPDQIWVSDKYAVEIAKTEFPSTQITQIPNRYMEDMLLAIKPLSRGEKDTLHILYVLEPIRQVWGTSELPGEFQALDYFMQHLSTLFLNEKVEIRLRPHPSDEPNKYCDWVLSQTSTKVYIDETSSLYEAISWSHVVAGCESFAMVVGLFAGRRTLSTIPPWGHSCRLPMKDIELLKEI
jgi:hypothetical protein